MSDVCISVDGCKVNLRVGALIVHAGAILLCRLPSAKWWFVPGGRVKLNETSLAALERELMEEIGTSFRVRRPRIASENFFLHDGMRYHELCTYYIVDWLGDEQLHGMEQSTEEFEWFRTDAIATVDLMPSFLQRVFRDLDAPLELIINQDGEERQPNQALQTTPMTRSGFGRVSVSDRQKRGV